MRRRTIRHTASGRSRPRSWAGPLVATALSLCTVTGFAQVSAYSIEYAKRLLTSSVLQADEDAAFEPITGGTVLATGTQAAVEGGTSFGIGYTEYGTSSGGWFPTSGPLNFQGNASFVGNPSGVASQGDAEYQLSGTPVLKTGPGYPIGFDFTYNGETFNRVGVSGQGWIGFGKGTDGNNAVAVYTSPSASAASLPLNNTTLLANDSRRNRVVATGVQGGGVNVGSNIMPILFTSGYNTYPGAELRYETIGTAPNRVFVVQWLNYGFTVNSLDHQYYRRMNFQIRLYETANKVEVRFGKAWRSNTEAVFQTGLGGKVGGNGPAGDFSSFGFYDATSNAWNQWPFAFTSQANHTDYPGSTEFGQRITWDGLQGYYPWNSHGDGSAEDFYAATFTHLHTNAGTGPNSQNLAQANRTISGGKANTPDMMSFTWTPSTCAQQASALVVTPSLTSVTLAWTGTGEFEYAVGTGTSPATAAFTGTTTSNSVNIPGLAASTNYKAWVRTTCGVGNASLWLPTAYFNTLPCPVSGFYYGLRPISRVQLGTVIDQASSDAVIYDGADPARFQDFTSVIGDVDPLVAYPLTVTGYSGGSLMYVTAFVDWDHDGVFEASYRLGASPYTYSASTTGSITGTITPPATALPGHARMRIVHRDDWEGAPVACGPSGMAGYYGQVEDYTLNVSVLTCPPPTGLLASGVGVHGANLSWTASSNSTGYQWEVRTSGAAGSGATGLVASGTEASTSTPVSGLASNTTHQFYVRSDCGAGDYSVWMSGSFKTNLGCGDTWISPGGVDNLTDVQFINTFTVCPEVTGDVVSLDFTTWNGLNWNLTQGSAIFIYDGDDTNAPMIAGTGTGYSSGTWVVPAGGWVTKPGLVTSTAASGCLTVKVMSYGSWTGGMGWSANFTCGPRPTCFAPTVQTVTGTTVHEASFTWNAGASPNVGWIVVANGGTPASPVLFQGTSASGSATVTGLTANTQYTAFFRGVCDDDAVGDDPSAWTGVGLNFRTKVGCGGPYDLYPTTAYAGYTTPRDSTITICPDNAGDVVTLTPSTFLFGWSGNGQVGLLVYDGSSTSAPQFHSGLPAKTSGSNTLPAGAYYATNGGGYTNSNLPGPFTSSVAGGCLTLRFLAFSAGSYDTGMKSDVTCAPAPACSTPSTVNVTNIGGTEVTVNWVNTTEPCIIEYGPTGFVPGTGDTAGTNGTVVSGATSPAIISGLTASTSYDVYVRQVCDGPSYSSNSFKAWFSTSVDCSTATVLTCATSQVQAFTGAAGTAAYHSSQFSNASTCFNGYTALNGETFLYKITAELAGDYQLSFNRTSGTGDEYFLTTPVENGCAASAFTCIGGSYYVQPPLTYATSQASGSNVFHLEAGDHYILMKGNPSVKTVNFRVLCPGLPLCVDAPTFPANNSVIALNTNPILFSWPASFGATGYDIYFNGSLVSTNHPTNSISSSSYTSAAVAALVGVGNPVTWRVVPRNSFGISDCATNYTFRVGGNGSANAIPLTEGVASAGNNFTANGYSNLNSNYWGNDSWFKFTASDCADSAQVQFCLSSANASTYLYLVVRRASDNAVVLNKSTYVTSGQCMILEEFDYDWYYEHYMDPDYVDRWIISTPTFPVVAGETYYLVADGYGTNYNFTMGYTEVLIPGDMDEDGIPDCVDLCPELAGEPGDACEAAEGFENGVIDENCECVGTPIPYDCLGVAHGTSLPGTPCASGLYNGTFNEDCECADLVCSGNAITIDIKTDANPDQTTWTIYDGSMNVVASGGPFTAANTVVSTDLCLPLSGDAYLFRVEDSFGDGLSGNGYWEVREQGGRVLLRDAFATGSVSPSATPASPSYGLGHQLLLPAGSANISAAYCGVYTYLRQQKVEADLVPGVSVYQFEFADPDAGFTRRIAVPRNWVRFNEMYTVPLVPGVTYFARVRVDQGAAGLGDDRFGGGCEIALQGDQTCTGLIDDASLPTFSCGVTRAFGANDKIWTYQVPGATQYRFRFVNTASSFTRTIVQSNYQCILNWQSAPLVAGTTYDVSVEAYVGGAWKGYCGPVCQLTIAGGTAPAMAPVAGNLEQVLNAQARIQLWPNPNTGDQVNVRAEGFATASNTVAIDVMDLSGKVAYTATVPVMDGLLNTVLDLGHLNNGVYMLRFTTGDNVQVERLVIRK